MVARGDRNYVRNGRFKDEEQARELDSGMLELMDREELPYTTLPADVDAINDFAATLLD